MLRLYLQVSNRLLLAGLLFAFSTLSVRSQKLSTVSLTNSHKNEVVVIDKAVENWSSIEKSISEAYTIIELNSSTNPWNEMAEKLAATPGGFTALHLVTHGMPGKILVGDQLWSEKEIATYTEEWAAIGRKFVKSPSLLLYGCSVGAKDLDLANWWHEKMGWTVQLSEDASSNNIMLGDWELEFLVGENKKVDPFQTSIEVATLQLSGSSVSIWMKCNETIFAECGGEFGRLDNIVIGSGIESTVFIDPHTFQTDISESGSTVTVKFSQTTGVNLIGRVIQFPSGFTGTFSSITRTEWSIKDDMGSEDPSDDESPSATSNYYGEWDATNKQLIFHAGPEWANGNFYGYVTYTMTYTPGIASSSITTSGTLNSFNSCSGSVSSAQTFTVGGSNLSANLVVTAPTGFEVSTSSGSGYGSSITLSPSSGTVSNTTIYVRLSSSASGSPSGNISCSSTNATTVNVAASGTVNALPTITLGAVSNVTTSATSFSLPYSATTGSPNQYSIATGSPTVMSGFSAVNNASLSSSPLNISIPASSAATYNFTITVRNSTTGCASSGSAFTVTAYIPAVAPTVTTAAATALLSSSATLGGNVTADGGATVTARGVVYSSTDATPTLGEIGVTTVTIGSGTGSFSQNITGLTLGTTYYYNSYATNSAGTSYGTVSNLVPLCDGSAEGSLASDQDIATVNITGSSKYLAFSSSCRTLSLITPSGTSPVNGTVAGEAWVHNTVPTFNSKPYVARNYEITPSSNASTATGTLTFYFSQSDFDAFNAVNNDADLPNNSTDAEGRRFNARIIKFSGTSSNGSGLPSTYTQPGEIITPSTVSWNGTMNRWEVTITTTGFGGFFLSNANLATASWTGGSGNWNTAANWSTGSVPDGNINIEIGTGTPTMNIDVTLVSGQTLNLSGTGALVIAPGKTLTIGGTADFGGKSVTLKSTADGTASIGQITGSLSNATNVTVERYIPATGRRYRLIAPSVNSTGTIRDNWMEGGLNTVVGTNVNPTGGYGVQITGTGGASNGFDATASNEASLYATTNGTTLSYSALANTSANLNALTGYFLFIRGDRSMNMTLPNTNVAPNPVALPSSSTTLRTTGTLLTGTQTIFTNALSSSANAMNLVTNPYASAINWADVYAASSNIKNYYTMWDPNIGFRGGFVTVTNTGTATPSDNLLLPNSTQASTTIQPGQAFFVTTATNGPASISIQEAHKVGTGASPNAVFGTAGVLTPSQLAVNLYYKESSGTVRLADGVRALFADGYQKTLDANDALEIANWDENLALLTSGKKLAVEARPTVSGYDTLLLAVNNLKKMDYQLQVNASGFANPLLQAALVDHFTQTTTPLSLSAATTVPFTVTTDPASSAVSRFTVIFSTTTALPLKFRNFLGQVKGAQTKLEFEVETEANVARYDIEKSNDGEGFAAIGILAPKAAANLYNSYQWADYARAGSSYYRIKAVSVDGSVQYSKVVKLTLGNSRAKVQAYPNPLRGKDFTLQLDQLEAGAYRLDWYNGQGQLLKTEMLQHPGGFYQHHPVVPATSGLLQWKLSSESNIWKGQLIQ